MALREDLAATKAALANANAEVERLAAALDVIVENLELLGEEDVLPPEISGSLKVAREALA